MGVSVIVPIYNAEQTLRVCIESILSQEYNELEIVLVDDGSTDGSGKICNDYAIVDSRIKTIHQENMGLAMARLTGCKVASMPDVMFVDSDDYIEPFLLSCLKKQMADDVDLVTSHLIFDDGLKSVRANAYTKIGVRDVDDILPEILENELGDEIGVEVSMCGKLFRRELLLDALGAISIRQSYGEDLEELLRYLRRAKKISLIDVWGYHYVKHADSMSNNLGIENYVNIKCIYDLFEAMSKEEDAKVICTQANLFIRSLLVETTKAVFPDIELGYISYVPPYEIIPQDSRLVIYGAGRVGKSMVKCLKASRYAEIVAWVDYCYGDSFYNIEIQPAEILQEANYDYVLIAVSIYDYVKQIKENLTSLGVPKNKILWKKPYSG